MKKRVLKEKLTFSFHSQDKNKSVGKKKKGIREDSLLLFNLRFLWVSCTFYFVMSYIPTEGRPVHGFLVTSKLDMKSLLLTSVDIFFEFSRKSKI